MVLGRFLRHFLVSSVKKHAPVNFQDQRFFETDVIKEKVVFKMSAEAHQVVIFKKIPSIPKCLELEANIFRAFMSLSYLSLVKNAKTSMR